jgi:hypothetical protein
LCLYFRSDEDSRMGRKTFRPPVPKTCVNASITENGD